MASQPQCSWYRNRFHKETSSFREERSIVSSQLRESQKRLSGWIQQAAPAEQRSRGWGVLGGESGGAQL